MGVTLRVWTHFSIRHIESAAFFARNCWKIEEQRGSKKYEKTLEIEHRALVTGCIFASVAFLEGTINELFASAADSSMKGGQVGQLPAETRRLMGSLWCFENFARRARTLEKFPFALRLAGKPSFETGSNSYQDTESLISLRNALIHYEPEWVPANPGRTDQKKLHRLDKDLEQIRNKPIFRASQAFLPPAVPWPRLCRVGYEDQHGFGRGFLMRRWD